MSCHESCMRVCFELARKGEGRVEPNPYVGCVITNKDAVIAKGYHNTYGSDHAEAVALRKAGARAKGATLYVNLEPCAHHGKTPPCADAIIRSGIKKVVVGCRDPNPLVSGKGISALKQAGIEVVESILEKESQQLNEIFFHWIRTGLPFVTMKLAFSADGMIAGINGKKEKLTCRASDMRTHAMRNMYQSIMVGANTVLHDNPMLTCRLGGKRFRDPLRIIIDPKLRLSPRAKVFADRNFLLACSRHSDKKKMEKWRNNMWISPGNASRIDLKALLAHLGSKKIASIFVEGGPTLLENMIGRKLVQKFHLILTPKILHEGTHWDSDKAKFLGNNMEVVQVGTDTWITGYMP